MTALAEHISTAQRLAATQAGVVGRQQLLNAGFSTYAIEAFTAQMKTPFPGVYYLPGEPFHALQWSAKCWVGVISGGDAAFLGKHAALHHYGILDHTPDEICVYTPRRKTTACLPLVFYRNARHLRRPAGGDGIPVATPEDALIDAAAEATETQLVNWLITACQHKTTNPTALLRRIAERGQVSHRALFGDVLSDVSGGSESMLERRYLCDVVRAHGLPVGERQFRLGARRVDQGFVGVGVVGGVGWSGGSFWGAAVAGF